MITALPAIDLRGGACVQLVGGSYDHERVRIDDPVAQARSFVLQGFRALHVVDLDAATGRGDNDAVLERLLAVEGLSVQIGGGVRSVERAELLLGRGARAVVVGTRAVEDPAFAESLANRFPNQVVVALDVRGTRVVTRGWAAETALDIDDALAQLAALPLAGVLVTAVHVEGALAGIDAPLYERVRAATRQRIIASGGVTTLADLEALDALGVEAAVIGMALYTGALDGAVVARRFGGGPS
ncbi:MAG: 1-(5-phosphoribosyl)-5-[(5-phosphoribosylamino)methylideneamino] imidazole-4-carboxamide isomerase [Polyangiaceae bacterium]